MPRRSTVPCPPGAGTASGWLEPAPVGQGCATAALDKLAAVDVTFVKAGRPGYQDRVYLTTRGVVRQGPVHVVHDLPHLVVESVFGIDDGLWAELHAGRHAAAARAVTARDLKRQKAGRIVSGAAAGVSTSQWLTDGHRRAKVLTNAVANRFGDGPDSPAGVRERVARSGEHSAEETLSGGEVLRLSWPLPPRLGDDA